jgi:hypothetical protein
LEGSGRGLILKYYPGIRLEGLRKIRKTLSGSRSERGTSLIIIYLFSSGLSVSLLHLKSGHEHVLPNPFKDSASRKKHIVFAQPVVPGPGLCVCVFQVSLTFFVLFVGRERLSTSFQDDRGQGRINEWYTFLYHCEADETQKRSHDLRVPSGDRFQRSALTSDVMNSDVCP